MVRQITNWESVMEHDLQDNVMNYGDGKKKRRRADDKPAVGGEVGVVIVKNKNVSDF